LAPDREESQRRSIRLQDYDYSQEGTYFVTICTYNKVFLFENDKIRNIAQQCWLEIPEHFPNVKVDAFVIMPNHIHGIVSIVDNCRGTACRAPTEKFGRPTPRSLPTIIRSFKSAVTKRVNALRGTPGARLWQHNYYEHVIRNEHDLNDTRQYILDNPVKWDMDENNPDRQINELKTRGELICLIR